MTTVIKFRIISYLLSITAVVISALLIFLGINYKTEEYLADYCFRTFRETNICRVNLCRYYPGRMTDRIEDFIAPQCNSKPDSAYTENVVVYKLMQLTEPFNFKIKIPFWQLKLLGKVYTPIELWEQRNSLAGEEVTVKGSVYYPSQVLCTQINCPCCNSCYAPMLLKIDKGASIQIRGTGGNSYNYGFYEGKEVACGGNECDLNCSPLQIEKEYFINGILKKGAKEKFYLELENFK